MQKWYHQHYLQLTAIVRSLAFKTSISKCRTGTDQYRPIQYWAGLSRSVLSGSEPISTERVWADQYWAGLIQSVQTHISTERVWSDQYWSGLIRSVLSGSESVWSGSDPDSKWTMETNISKCRTGTDQYWSGSFDSDRLSDPFLWKTRISWSVL